MSEIIRLENVIKINDKNYRKLNGINLCVQERENVAFYGPLGSGKETLLMLIAGMFVPSEGKIFVLDQKIHDMNKDLAASFRNQNIGILHRNSGFINYLNIIENIELPLTIQGVSTAKRKKDAKDMLDFFNLSYIAHMRNSMLSPYKMLMASLARALICRPSILLMYEATAELSEQDYDKFNEQMNRIFINFDITALTFTSNINDISDRYKRIVIKQGEIQEDLL